MLILIRTMKEQFDKALRDHIKDTFDQFDDHLSDDGWKKFEKKVRNKKRRIIALWSFPTGIAAALALLWLVNINPEITDQNSQKIAKNNDLLEEKVKSPKQINDTSLSSNTSIKDEYAYNGSSSKSEDYLFSDKRPLNKSTEKPDNNVYINSNRTALNIITLSNETSYEDSYHYDQVHEVIYELKKPSIIPDSFYTVASIIQNIKNTSPLKTDTFQTQSLFKEDQREGYFNNPHIQNAYNNQDKKSLSPKKNRLKLGLDATTFMNFTQDGLNEEVNIGFGLTSEYKISKKLSFNSGINLNRQTTSFISAKAEEAVAENSAFRSSIASIINNNFSDAKLVGIDLPLNLKYSIIRKKSSYFFSTGISAYTLINEKYLSNISIINYGFDGVKTNNIITEEENPRGSFSYFNLARTLNVSFGMSYPLKNNSSLSIEPFVKYPLGGLGYENLKIGSTGVSFKMNFNSMGFN